MIFNGYTGDFMQASATIVMPVGSRYKGIGTLRIYVNGHRVIVRLPFKMIDAQGDRCEIEFEGKTYPGTFVTDDTIMSWGVYACLGVDVAKQGTDVTVVTCVETKEETKMQTYDQHTIPSGCNCEIIRLRKEINRLADMLMTTVGRTFFTSDHVNAQLWYVNEYQRRNKTKMERERLTKEITELQKKLEELK